MDRINLDEDIKDKLLIGFAQKFLSEGKYIKNVFNSTVFHDKESKNQALEMIREYTYL